MYLDGWREFRSKCAHEALPRQNTKFVGTRPEVVPVSVELEVAVPA